MAAHGVPRGTRVPIGSRSRRPCASRSRGGARAGGWDDAAYGPPARTPRRRRCVRYVLVAGSSTRRNRPAGADSFRFIGRLYGRALAPGAYRLSGVPIDAARNRGRALSARFTVVR